MKNSSQAGALFAGALLIVSMLTMTGCAQTGETPSITIPSSETNAATGTVTIEPADDFTMEPGESQTDMIKLYFIELETKDLKAYRIGCGDAVIAVDAKYAPSKDEKAAETALKMLFAVKDRTYGEKKLYNSLYQSDLKLESLTVDNNRKATLKLSGTMMLGGVCDAPRFEEQIRQTVLQFNDLYSDVEIFLNDKPLKDLLSGRG
jgi:hypothetical protein